MKYNFLVISIISFTTYGCVNSPLVKESDHPVPVQNNRSVNAFDDRSTDVNIVNDLSNPISSMTLVDKGINPGWDSGEWKILPPSAIGYNLKGKMGTTSNTWLHGTGGWVKYKVKKDGAILTFSWVNPYSGSNSYYASASNDDYEFIQTGGGGNNASVTWCVKRKTQPKPITNYSAIIMSDPQAWRLDSGGDPNSDSENGAKWREINKKTFNSILSHKNVKFHINNGDLTEFGRKAQYDDYHNIYHSSGTIVAEGLGNHDYANNVGDCVAPDTGSIVSKNGCAVSAVVREYTAIQNIKNNLSQISGSAFSSDITKETFTTETSIESIYEGSLAYSWDVGDVHYIQLQNYPTYTVHMSVPGYASADITSSLDWLADDLERADLRGKETIVNFHDASAHFLDKNHLSELLKFKSIITSHNVIAIFAGHTHSQEYCRAKDDAVFGNIPIYTSGALFDGDYYLINVKGKKIDVNAYNGQSGVAVLIKELGTIGSDTQFANSCTIPAQAEGQE